MTQPIHDEKLQQYFDGELNADEAAELKKQIASSRDSIDSLKQLEAFSKAMSDSASDWAEQVDSSAMFAAIENRIENETGASNDASSMKPGLRVIRGGGQRRKVPDLAIGFAAAAALCLAVLAWPKSQPNLAPPQGVEVASTSSSSRGTEIEEVDFGDNTGTVFAVEGAGGQLLAVVWISEDEVGLP